MIEDFERFDDQPDDEVPQAWRTERRDPVARGIRARAWIAGILAFLGVLIFVADRYLVLVKPNIERFRQQRDLDGAAECEQELHRILGDYGILDTWIRKRRIDVANGALHRDEWLISIPRDIAVASINFEIKTALESLGTHTFAVENAKTRQVTVHLRIGSAVRYSLVFTPTAAVKRMAGRLIFMVDRLAEAPSSEIDALLASPDPVVCCITPSREAMQIFEKLRVARKEIALHIHIAATKEDHAQYALSEEHSRGEVLRKLQAMTRNFQGAQAFFVTSEVAPSTNGTIVQEQLMKTGLKNIDPAVLSYMDRTSESATMTARVNDVSNSAVRNGFAIGVVELDDGIIPFLAGEMSRLRKRGFSFITLSQM